MKFAVAILLALLSLPLFAQTAAEPSRASVDGRYVAAFTYDAGGGRQRRIPFEIELSGAPDRLQAVLINGDERTPFSSAVLRDGEIVLALDHYNATIRFAAPPASPLEFVEAKFERKTRRGFISQSLRLSRKPSVAEPPTPDFDLSGSWLFHFERGESGAPEDVATPLRQKGSRLEGSVAYVSGDLGLLAGGVGLWSDGSRRFFLHRFDGVHIIELSGQLLPDGSLRGELFSNGSVSAFTAARAGGDKALANLEAAAESATQLRDAKAVFRFHGKDLATGRTLTEADFAGQPVIVDVMGTWCPNCHDEAPVLTELARKYAAQGLRVVALSYESDDEKESGRLIEIFKKKYGAGFPILYGGASDDVSSLLPDLSVIAGFPTTLFIDRSGRVSSAHAGFEGAATGQLEALRARFDELARKLLQ